MAKKERKVLAGIDAVGSKKVLQLTFEEAITVKLARACRSYAAPTWVYQGRTMTSVHGICKTFALGELRDYVKVVEAVAFLGEDYGLCTKDHFAPSDSGPVHIPKKFMEDETPLIYLDRVEEVLSFALPRKGPQRISLFKGMF